MEIEDLRARSSQSGESAPEIKYIPVDEKIEPEIRELVRIRPEDFRALKVSFEEWANQWN